MWNKIKQYFKDKWTILKPILIKKAEEMKVILLDYLKRMWASIVSHTEKFAKNLWNKIKELWAEIKEKVLVKELAFFEKVGDWAWNKADAIFEKVHGELRDLETVLEMDFDEPKEDVAEPEVIEEEE